MALASSVKVVLGSIAFAIFWVLAVFPAVPFLPVGRTAYDVIDLQILGLLFGTMFCQCVWLSVNMMIQ